MEQNAIKYLLMKKVMFKNLTILTVFISFVCQFSVMAEVIMDGTCGENFKINGPDYLIKDEYGKLVGNNLFHSFEFFNIDTNEKAIFTSSSDVSIQNIISRVTGGSLSLIDGTIQSNIEGANFYLLNPSGIMFGPNASINIDGSFHVSTADYLKMGDQKFYANPQMNISEFSSASPEVFGFLDNNSIEGINVNGSNIEIAEDKTLSIIGGDITIENGTLSVPKGRINIASTASEVEVVIQDQDDVSRNYIEVNTNNALQGGTIEIINSKIKTNGGKIDISTSNTSNDDLIFQRQGLISIMDHSEIYSNNTEMESSIVIHGNDLKLDESSIISEINNIEKNPIEIELDGILELDHDALILSSNNGYDIRSDITLHSEQLILYNGGKIESMSLENGKSGNISANVLGEILIEGIGESNTINSRSGIYQSGNQINQSCNINLSAQSIVLDNLGVIKSDLDTTADIQIKSNTLSLRNGGKIESIKGFNKNGYCGNLIIESDNLLIDGYNYAFDNNNNELYVPSSIDFTSYGDTFERNIKIYSSELSINNGGNISASNMLIAEKNNIYINSKDNIHISGYGVNSIKQSGIYNVTRLNEKNAGNITIQTPELYISDRGQISNQTYLSSGNGGNIQLDVSTLKILDGGVINNNSNLASGTGGSINISSESVLLSGYFIDKETSGILLSSINAWSSGTGNSGHINIETNYLDINYGIINTDVYGSGDGGDINIQASRIILDQHGSYITSDTYNDGKGGNISINTQSLNITNGATISASVIGNKEIWDQYYPEYITDGHPGEGRGAGGNIIIQAGHSIDISGFSSDGNLSSIQTSTSGTAISEQGNGGIISISAPVLTISNAAWIDSGTINLDGDAGNIIINVDKLSLLSGGQISATTSSEGKGGMIKITSKKLTIAGKYNDSILSAIQNRSLESGNAGNTVIMTSNLNISNGGCISADSEKTGVAGMIDINVTNALELFSNSFISTKTEKADGGNIDIDVFNLLHMNNASINTSVKDDEGDGGNITINNPDFIVLDNSNIKANAFEGNGGNISIQSDYFFQFPDSIVNASSAKGVDGSIKIQSSVKDISGGLTLLPDSFFDATPLIKQVCSSKDNENQFSFLPGSRETFPPLPYDYYNKKSNKDDSDLMKQLAKVLKYIDKKSMYDALIKRLDEIKNTAERTQEKNVLSFAYGYTGYIFKELGRIDDAVVETRRAIFWSQQNYSPETEFLWHAQLGRILKETGKEPDTENAIKSYKYSIHLLGDSFKEITNTTFNNKIIKSFNTRQEIINKLINSTNNTKQKINKILSLNKNNDFFNEYVKPVYFELAGILFDKSRIEEATEVLELLKDFEIQQFFKDECAARLKTEPLKYLPPKTALIQFVPLSQKLLILLTLPALDKKKPDIIPAYISQKKLNRFIGQLMNEIKSMNPEVSIIKNLSKKLYDQLINPIKTTLEDQKIETLVILPEGIIRKIPFSVLYDGHKYLIEKFALAVIPSKSRVNMLPVTYDNILVGAFSEGTYQLDFVSNEVDDIKTKFPESKILLNENFIYNNLNKELEKNHYSIVHIASHSHFGGSFDDIYITLWGDKKLKVNDFIRLLEHANNNNMGIELLTLSGCETAKENDRFILGLSGLAMKAGVKSIIGSLWEVYDKETSEIINQFYDHLIKQSKNQQITKAKALQESIKKMIAKKVNPVCWAPFILVGNWL